MGTSRERAILVTDDDPSSGMSPEAWADRHVGGRGTLCGLLACARAQGDGALGSGSPPSSATKAELKRRVVLQRQAPVRASELVAVLAGVAAKPPRLHADAVRLCGDAYIVTTIDAGGALHARSLVAAGAGGGGQGVVITWSESHVVVAIYRGFEDATSAQLAKDLCVRLAAHQSSKPEVMDLT